MNESCSSENHREFTGVVRIIEPAIVSGVPGVEPARKSNHPISGFSPHSEGSRRERKQDLFCMAIQAKID